MSQYYFPTLQDIYPTQLGKVTLEEFYRAINIAKPGYIRIEADELTCNLHIMVRYELEKGLVAGEIAVADLPRLWNEKYEAYLGLTPRNNKEGIASWLNENIHQYGALKTPGRLIRDITGEPLNPAYLTDYFEKKFEDVYFG